MTNRLLIVTMLFLLAFSPSGLKAADWRSVVDLRGTWYFTVGDDPAWADPDTDISDWDRISAPRGWENYYEGYNGFGWYRKSFSLDHDLLTKQLTLFLGYIDDVDEVFINGQKIGQTGEFPPYAETAYNRERRYLIPDHILKSEGNVICVRVYDYGMNGGIVSADKFGLYFDQDIDMLEVDLSGNWKFSTSYYRGVHDVNFDDNDWNEIYVPEKWESQGYEGYNGYAYYRKKITISDQLLGQDLFLVMGRIDDFDKVYLNGHEIGRVEDLESYSRFRKGNSYRLMRIYKMPKEYLKNKSLITVEVYDGQGDGGIYEGPVGIVGRRSVELLSRKYHEDWTNNGWGSFINDLIDLLD